MNSSSLEALHAAIAAGDADAALESEYQLYMNVVKVTETEEHYRECFAQWSDAMRELGEKNQCEPAHGDGVCFFVHSGAFLAHVQLMRDVIAARGAERVIVCVASGDAAKLSRHLDVPVIGLGEKRIAGRLRALNSVMRERKCGTLVWVSAPLYASYALATRIAERQVFWALRFHPVISPHIDRYVTQGKRGEVSRVYNGQDWRCAHAPLSVDVEKVSENEAERFRLQLSHEIVIGTCAREEKIAHPQYLQCVAEILRAMPTALFLWTGKNERADIRNFFIEMGLARQQRFVGWVEPNKFVCLLDVFLETFPQGGIMSHVAMHHGVPVVGMMLPTATYGWLDQVPRNSGAAASDVEYVNRVITLATDRVKRAQAVEAGCTIMERERSLVRDDARSAWRALCG